MSTLPQTDSRDQGAEFSVDRKYRYALWRIWDRTKPMVMFIGLNPSTANETDNDPTIRSCKRIAAANGFGGFLMMNCWPYISTDPTKMGETHPQADNWNMETIRLMGPKCGDVVFAWGAFPIVKARGQDVRLMKMFPDAKALHINKDGSPKHPLYCKTESKFIQFINHTNTPNQ